MPFSGHPRRYRYQQVTVPEGKYAPPAVDLFPPYVARLKSQPCPRLGSWTQDVLRKLVAAGHLGEEDLEAVPDPENEANRFLLARNPGKVAWILSNYLASGKDFSYKLETRRQDLSIDPIEDFLFHVKQGYCQQFATGLVLMLRSVGIPARIVLGFRGADPKNPNREGDGWYVIRQSQAHSWVEALVTRPGPGGQPESYWLTLDPTPNEEVQDSTEFSWLRLWERTQESLRDGWKTLILDYNLDMQTDALAALWNGLALKERFHSIGDGGADSKSGTGSAGGGVWLLLAVPPFLVLGGWLGRRLWLWRRHGTAVPPIAIAFYQRWLTLVWRHYRLQPRPSQTPREFAENLTRDSQQQPVPSLLTEVSQNVVQLYYRVRYGDRPLLAGEENSLERQFKALEAALTRPGPSLQS